MLKLHSKLERAFSIVSGAQQPDHPDYYLTEDEKEEMKFYEESLKKEVEDLIKGVVSALGYDTSKIVLKEKE